MMFRRIDGKASRTMLVAILQMVAGFAVLIGTFASEEVVSEFFGGDVSARIIGATNFVSGMIYAFLRTVTTKPLS